MDKSDILPALEFNGNHSGDKLARAYFKMAAREIRSLRAQRMSLQADLVSSRIDVRGLENALAGLIVEVYGSCP